jgi:hypothetical protein
MMAKNVAFEQVQGTWYEAKKVVPNDHRDVLAFIRKPIWVEAHKRFELYHAMEVIHMEANGAWFLEGKPLPPKNVIRWCEIPMGWQGKWMPESIEAGIVKTEHYGKANNKS